MHIKRLSALYDTNKQHIIGDSEKVTLGESGDFIIHTRFHVLLWKKVIHTQFFVYFVKRGALK